MTWLLTNDDGVYAPGLAALAAATSEPTLVVAPLNQHSGCGHQVTTQAPLQLKSITDVTLSAQAVYGTSGAPADCVRIAQFHLSTPVSWVIAGINAGANMGVDCYMSGTVAAVREGALHGLQGVAVSQYRKGAVPIDWPRATRWTQQVLQVLRSRPLPTGRFWNVNLPHTDSSNPEMVFCKPSVRPLPVKFRQEVDLLHYEGTYAERDREPGSDVDVCLRGQIAITQLSI